MGYAEKVRTQFLSLRHFYFYARHAIRSLPVLRFGVHERPKRTIYSFIPPRGFLTKPGFDNHTGEHGQLYPGFPQIVVPDPFTHR